MLVRHPGLRDPNLRDPSLRGRLPGNGGAVERFQPFGHPVAKRRATQGGIDSWPDRVENFPAILKVWDSACLHTRPHASLRRESPPKP